jgi:hypothetical protein
MSRPVLYLAITNHGFGHAVRMASVANQVKKLNPDILIVFVTTAPRWLLQSYLDDHADFIYRPRAFDIGVIQSDGITMDLAATLAKMQEFQRRETQIVAGEVNFIRLNQVKLILADLPAMAVTIAQSAGIPCWMMGNFGWDFIYSAWGSEFQEIAAWISQRYQQCDRLFRLPMHESMSSFPRVEDVGLTGGNPRYSEVELREKFLLDKDKEKTVLLTFGGLGLQAIPYHNLQHFPDWQFITFAQNVPDLPNLVKIIDNSYRPVDFMPLCGRVISKPGFSTFAEAIRLQIPIVSLTRDGFAESPLLMEGLKKYSYHQIIDGETFFASKWEFLASDLQSPQTKTSVANNGAETIAQAIVKFLSSNSKKI